MNGIILEGITATGKTQILNEIEHILIKTNQNSSKLFLREFYTERMIEDYFNNGTMTKEIVTSHVEKYLQIVETFSGLYNSSKWGNDIKDDQLVIYLERFIYSFLIKLEEGFLEDAEIISILKRLNTRSIKIVILTLDEEVIVKKIMDTINYRNNCWGDFLGNLGSESEVKDIFVTRQNNLIKMAKKYSNYIDTIYINSSFDSYTSISKKIYKKGFF